MNTRDGMTEVTIRRIGSMPVPVHIAVTLEGGTAQSVSESASVWTTGADEATFRIEHTADIFSLRLGDTWIV